MAKLAEVIGGVILASGCAIGLYRMLMAWARGIDAKHKQRKKN